MITKNEILESKSNINIMSYDYLIMTKETKQVLKLYKLNMVTFGGSKFLSFIFNAIVMLVDLHLLPPAPLRYFLMDCTTLTEGTHAAERRIIAENRY